MSWRKLPYSEFSQFLKVVPSDLKTSAKCSAGDYRYGFQGQEMDDEVKGEGNSYDFGARMYDSRIGRWFAIDKLFAKRPSQSPYSFVGSNPVMNREIDGNDYEVIINKSDKGNTITIKATYYTDIEGSESHLTAKKATEFRNSQNGKFKYQVNEEDGTVTDYDVVFELDVKEVSAISKKLYGTEEGMKNDSYDDPKGNSLVVLEDKEVAGGAFGGTVRGRDTEIAKSRKDSDTPEHEVGHTLNLGHFSEGLMKEIDMNGKIKRESIVKTEYIQQILDFAFGKGDMKSSTAPISKANTKVVNPTKEKVDGKVSEISK